MKHGTSFVILGFLVALTPFLGFPGVWETFFIVIVGLAIAALSFWEGVKKRAHSSNGKITPTQISKNEAQEIIDNV